MCRQPLGCALLIVPIKPVLTIRRELNIVGRVGINEVVRLYGNRSDVVGGEQPVSKQTPESGKVVGVVDCLVAAKRHIEFAALIETAETVKACPVQIIEELCGFLSVGFPRRDQLVEAIPVPVESLRVIFHLDAHFETTLQVLVEVYQMRIDVIEQRALRS